MSDPVRFGAFPRRHPGLEYTTFTTALRPAGRSAKAFKKSGRRAAELCPTGALMLKGMGCAACRIAAVTPPARPAAVTAS